MDKIPRFLNPMGFAIGITTGMAISLAVGNFWIGLGAGVVIGALISPLYAEKKRADRIKNGYAFLLLSVIVIALIAALSLSISAI